MRILRTLLWKEWRDHRALILVAAVLMAALTGGGELLYGEAFDAELRTTRFLPVVWLAFLTVLSADVSTCDHQHGMSETLGRLPMLQRLVWVARAIFVIACGTIALVGLLLLEISVQAWEQVPPTSFQRLVDARVLAAALLVVTGVLAAGGLMRRPLTAALVGLALPIGLPFAVRFLPHSPLAEWVWITCSTSPWGPFGLGLILAGAMACAALAGHTPWRRRRPLQRVWVAAGALLVLMPTGIAAGRIGWARTDLVPHAVGVQIQRIEPSPDGRHVALEVHRDLPIDGVWRFGDRVGGLRRSEVWILDRETGLAAQIDERARVLYAPSHRWVGSVWGADGLLHTVSSGGPSMGGGPMALEAIDPSTRGVVRRVPATDHERFERERGIEPWYESEMLGDQTTVRWRGRDAFFGLYGTRIWATPVPGFVLFIRDGRIVRRDLIARTEQDLGEAGEGSWIQQSPDGRHIAVWEGQVQSTIDVVTGACLASGVPKAMWCRGDENVLISESRLLRADGTWLDLPGGGAILPFDERHALRPSGGRFPSTWDLLELVHLETGAITPLYGPRTAED